MSWELVKRHRNKIAAVATAVGGVYAMKKVLDHQGINPADWFGTKSKQTEKETVSESRKHFIFDSHQESCDKQVLETVDGLMATLNSRFDIEQFVRRLETEENMDTREKIELWEQMKVKTFARILSLAYMHSLVLIALKTQKSILCRETIKNFEKTDNKPTGFLNYLTSLFTEPPNAKSGVFTDPKAQQVFLNCIHYLTTHGLAALYDRIEACTHEVVGEVPLTKKYDVETLKGLFEKLKFRLERSGGDCNFADLVVPVANSKALLTSADYNAVHLEELLSKLSAQLQSPRARAVLSGFVQRYVNETVDFVENKTGKQSPLAKLVPALNVAYEEISATSYNSILQQNVASSELYRLCQMVFSS